MNKYLVTMLIEEESLTTEIELEIQAENAENARDAGYDHVGYNYKPIHFCCLRIERI